jgi:hypothetical protein
MKTLKCTTCFKETILPYVAVRLGGTLRCPNNHTFEYDVKKYYKKNGVLKSITLRDAYNIVQDNMAYNEATR